MKRHYPYSVSFWFTAYTLFVVVLGTNVPSPLYGVYRTLWHFSSGTVTLLFAVYALVLIPSNLVAGQLSDSFGRRKMLISGVFMAVAATLVFAFAHNTWMLFLARGIQGLCVGTLSGSAVATLAELRHTDRKHASLVASVAIAIGSAVGPLYSGVVAQYTALPIRLPYYIDFVLLAPAVIATLTMKYTPQHQHIKRRVSLPNIPASIRFEFLTASFIGAFAWAMAGFFMVVAPTFVTSLVGIKNLAIAGVVVFLMLGSSAVTQILLKGMEFQKTIFTGFGLLIAGVVCVGIAIPTHALWLLLASTLAAGAGHGPISSATLHHASEIAPKESTADTISSYYAIAYLGVSVPVLGLGFIAEWIGMYYGILVFGAVIVTALLVLSRFVVFMFKDKKLLVRI